MEKASSFFFRWMFQPWRCRSWQRSYFSWFFCGLVSETDSVGNICVLLNKVWIRQFWRPFPIKTRKIQYMICLCHHWRLTPDLIFYKTSPGTLYSLCVSLHFGTWYKISGAVHVTETHPEMKDTLWDKDVRSKTRHDYMYIYIYANKYTHTNQAESGSKIEIQMGIWTSWESVL